MSFVVAIDGSSGTGKGTIANMLAKNFNLMYLDTGATYRCITLEVINKKIKLDELDKIEKILKEIKIEFKDDKTFLNGEDVTKQIRENNVNELVSQVSHIPIVRKNMIELQRRIAEGKNIVLDGRDIGTVVFPNADVKFYFDATLEERALRRYKQNQEKGIESTLEECKANLKMRDDNDKSSSVSPLKQADDAIYFDTTNLSIKQEYKKIAKIVKKKIKEEDLHSKAYKIGNDNPLKVFTRYLIRIILGIPYTIVYFPHSTNKHYFKEEAKNGCIVCANHVNLIDAAGIVIYNNHPIDFVAKVELFKNKFLVWFGHTFMIIPVNRCKNDIDSVKLCLKALKNKRTLGIFPEGTRNGLEKHEKVKNGAVYLAYKTGKKIVPVGIQGSFKPFRPIVFNYGKPFDPKDYKTDDENWVDKATEKLMEQIVELTKHKEN